MSIASRRGLLKGGLIVFACACAAPRGAFAAETSPTGKWICPPCGCSADGKDFDKPGVCPACGLDLIPKPADAKDAQPQAPKAGG
jgi:hypothetical protein